MSINRTINTSNWGGVKNVGNTCALSAFIQELSVSSSYYTPFLTEKLQQNKSETNKAFKGREKLQAYLYQAVTTVESGQTLSRRQVHKIVRKILDLKFVKEWSSSWRRYLYRLAPSLFSLPMVDVNRLYAQILEKFPTDQSVVEKICYLNQESKKKTLESLIQGGKKEARLFRVTKSPDKNEAVQQQLKSNHRLKLVHAIEKSLFSKHIVTYRPLEDSKWLYISDARVKKITKTPKNNHYVLVYEAK